MSTGEDWKVWMFGFWLAAFTFFTGLHYLFKWMNEKKDKGGKK